MYDFNQGFVDREDIETVDDYIWAAVQEHYFDPPAWSPTYWGAITLYEKGMFGRILSGLERVDWERIEHAVTGDCSHCGAPDVGGAGPEYRGCYELPDGEEVYVTAETVFCDGCLEKYIHDLTTYGEIQPTISGWA